MKTLQIGMGWFPEQPGGLNRFYYGCLRHLPKLDVAVNGLVAGANRIPVESDGKILNFAQRESSLVRRWWGMRQAFHRFSSPADYDVVASHFALYTLPVLDLVSGQPLVVHFHGPWALEGDVEGNRTFSTWCKKQIEQPCYNRASRFIVLSQAFRDILHREYDVPIERIHIVPGGVDIEQFQSGLSKISARQRLGWPTDRPILLTVRRLAHRMGLENLIAAIKRVRHQHPDVLLLIAGKGSLQEALTQQISALSLENHVRLLGYLPDEHLPLAYRAADVSVVPTVALEGFGLIVIESLAAGTPVVGTPIGGIPEILKPLAGQLVFPSAGIADMAAHLGDALSGQLGLPDANACQNYVRANYAWPVIAQQIKAVYQQALGG